MRRKIVSPFQRSAGKCASVKCNLGRYYSDKPSHFAPPYTMILRFNSCILICKLLEIIVFIILKKNLINALAAMIAKWRVSFVRNTKTQQC